MPSLTFLVVYSFCPSSFITLLDNVLARVRNQDQHMVLCVFHISLLWIPQPAGSRLTIQQRAVCLSSSDAVPIAEPTRSPAGGHGCQYTHTHMTSSLQKSKLDCAWDELHRARVSRGASGVDLPATPSGQSAPQCPRLLLEQSHRHVYGASFPCRSS